MSSLFLALAGAAAKGAADGVRGADAEDVHDAAVLMNKRGRRNAKITLLLNRI